MSSGDLVYCLDTSAFVDMVHEQPEDLYPGLWKCMAGLAESGRLIMVENAYYECKDPEAQSWLKAYACIKRPRTEDVLASITHLQSELANDKQFIEDPKSTKSKADPFVIALAMSENMARGGKYSSGDVVVVHHESATNNPTGKVKIADVCRRFSIRSLRIVDVVRQENWVFDLRAM